jgi:magnesium chelatase family protein
MFMEVSKVEYDKLSSGASAESSTEIQKRVQAARDRQSERFKGTSLVTNSEMGVSEIRRMCALGDKERDFVRRAALKLKLSARAYHRVIKLARTIADLAASEQISSRHLAEAMHYRPKIE